MSQQLSADQSTKETKLERRGYAVMDKFGLQVHMENSREAKQMAKRWNKAYPSCSPHRAVELLFREIR